MPETTIEDMAEVLMAKLRESGQLVEVGWVSYRCSLLHPRASLHQQIESRRAFLSGALYLWSILQEAGTEENMKVIDLIEKELKSFIEANLPDSEEQFDHACADCKASLQDKPFWVLANTEEVLCEVCYLLRRKTTRDD